MTQFTVDIIYIYMSDKRKIQQGGKKNEIEEKYDTQRTKKKR